MIRAYFVGYACMSFTMKALAAATLKLHWSSIMVVLYEVMLYEVMLWLYYGCISQERGYVMATVTARRE